MLRQDCRWLPATQIGRGGWLPGGGGGASAQEHSQGDRDEDDPAHSGRQARTAVPGGVFGGVGLTCGANSVGGGVSWRSTLMIAGRSEMSVLIAISMRRRRGRCGIRRGSGWDWWGAGDRCVTELGAAALLELSGEERVEGFEFLRVVTGQDHSAPHAVGGAGGDRVVTAATSKRARGAALDRAVSPAGIEEQLGVLPAG